jgi:hypothetical protein
MVVCTPRPGKSRRCRRWYCHRINSHSQFVRSRRLVVLDLMTDYFTSHTIYLMLLITAFALVLTFGFLVLLRAFPRQILHITLILTILYSLGIAIWYFTQGYYSGAIIFALFFIVFCFAYFGYRCVSPPFYVSIYTQRTSLNDQVPHTPRCEAHRSRRGYRKAPQGRRLRNCHHRHASTSRSGHLARLHNRRDLHSLGKPTMPEQ